MVLGLKRRSRNPVTQTSGTKCQNLNVFMDVVASVVFVQRKLITKFGCQSPGVFTCGILILLQNHFNAARKFI